MEVIGSEGSCPANSQICSTPQETDLILIGKTGHGKSTTGNCILGREAFGISDSVDSDTFEVQAIRARRKGRVIKVVDTPGLAETRINGSEATEKLVEDMAKGISQSPKGFHALILILRYGSRFTEEEYKVVKVLKTMFGDDFVKNFVIVVFTHGELFDSKYRKNPRPFIDWCKEQKGNLKSLLEECSYRVVLFNNYGDEKVEQQVDELLRLVDNLASHGKRYTSELFDKLDKEGERMIVEENAVVLKEAIQRKIDFLLQGLTSLIGVTKFDINTKNKIELLQEDARELKEEIIRHDRGTGVLQPLNDAVRNIQDNVQQHKEYLLLSEQTKESKRKYDALMKKHNNVIGKLEAIKGRGLWATVWGKIKDMWHTTR